MTAGRLQLDREAFLARYWQREPLLIREAIPAFKPPLDAAELAGLALEAGVESRLIEYRDQEWLLQHGPFTEADFNRDAPWTLLVQAVDHYVDEVAGLRRLVDFLPQWLMDDVMVSYAVDGGSVGPHYDNYDVFLLQGEGRRHWRVGQACDSRSALLPHRELRILRDFDCQQEFLLEPGDMLYLPPGQAHWGIAQGECTTFSIGLRAPRINDLLSRWADQMLEGLAPDLFYRDRQIEPVSRAGEIRPRDLQQVAERLRVTLADLDRQGDNRWFGEVVTEPRYDVPVEDGELANQRALLAGGACQVELDAAGRVAWQETSAGVAVFANGQAQEFAATVLPWLVQLCGQWRLEGQALAAALAQPDGSQLLDYLLTTGCIYVE